MVKREMNAYLKVKEIYRKIPLFWKNIILILAVGILIGLIAISIVGLYIGVTVLFFAISVPFAVYTYQERKRIDDIEKHLSDFLRDLAEYNVSGLPLAQAIMQTAKSDYGALTPEIKKLAAEISWGVPFEEALERLQNRINSPFVRKAVTIITTAEAQGGEVNAILQTLAEDLRKLKQIEEERKGKLSVYTATIYVIFLLLLAIMVMLTATLAPAIPKIQVAGQFFGGMGGGLTEKDFRTLLFHVSLIEAFFAGLISGQMGEGSVTAGLKHSIVLVAITLFAFSFVSPAPPAQKIAESIIEIPPVEGIQGTSLTYESTFKESFTVTDVADRVRELAKERNLQTYKTFTPDKVKFVVTTCNACNEGKINIDETTVTVNEPTDMKYRVYFSGGKYIVEFSDAT